MPKIGSTQVSRTVKRKINKRLNHLNFNCSSKITSTCTLPASNLSNLECSLASNSECSLASNSLNNIKLNSDSLSFPNIEHNGDNHQPTSNQSKLANFEIGFELRKWAINNNVKLSSVNELLFLLKRHQCFKELPNSARTLLKTPRTNNIQQLFPGKYCHFPLSNTLNNIVSKFNLTEISLQLNIDGLPISKSSSQQFWPILADIVELPTFGPFVLGLYYGEDKPASSNELLKISIQDLINCSNITLLNGRTLKVKVHSIVCDAPARSFILNVKGHNGYFGCNKCIVEGEYFDHRVTFPDTDKTLRTNESFRQKTNDDYHLNNDSELLKLPIDIVAQIPLDYQHLVCLGVVRKLLNLWIKGKVRTFRLCARDTHTISQRLIQIKFLFSKEFARKPRILIHLKNWKATELRTFLLYSGPVVLLNILPNSYYNHFLSLHVAITILCCKTLHVKYLSYAEKLILYFVENFSILYGKENLSYNVHSLIHLAADSSRFGVLDLFSTFKFENKLGKIKRLLRSGNRPLEQVYNRISEQQQFVSGEVNYFSESQLKKEFNISTSAGDNVCVLKDGSALVVKDIIPINEVVFMKGTLYHYFGNYYSNPCSSDLLGISVYVKKEDSYTVKSSQVVRKALLFLENNRGILFPLLHTS